jgi:hypothetical protein
MKALVPRSRDKTASLVPILFVGTLLIAVILGVAIAALPPGILVRMVLPFVAGGIVVLAWATRSDGPWRLGNVLHWYLLLVVVLSVIWPRYLFLHAAGLPGINPLTLSTMIGLAVILIAIASSRQFAHGLMSEMRNGGVAATLVLVWLGWRFLASFLGEEPVYSVIDLVKETVYVASFLIFGYVLAGWKDGPINVARVMVICGLAVASIGVVEAFVQHNPFIGLISSMGDEQAPRALVAIAAEKVREGAYRAQSTFDHPIVFAQFVAALVPLALFMLLRDSSKFWRFIGFLTIPVALLAIVKSGSRSGYVSVATAFALVFGIWWIRALVHGKFSKIVAIVSLPALAGSLLLAWYFVAELVTGRNQVEISSSSVRMKMLKDGIGALWDSPIWGFGHGLSVSKAGVINPMGIATIDNYLLTIALDYGYVGFLLFIAGVATFSVGALLFAVRKADVNGAFVGACLASVLALVATFAGVSIYQNMTMLWLLVALCAPIIAGRNLR